MKEKRNTAVALKYNQQKDNAPKVIAKGKGIIADRLITLAGELNIPIHHDPDLVEVLSRLNMYEEIPKEVYAVVAKILSFVYKLNNKAKNFQ